MSPRWMVKLTWRHDGWLDPGSTVMVVRTLDTLDGSLGMSS